MTVTKKTYLYLLCIWGCSICISTWNHFPQQAWVYCSGLGGVPEIWRHSLENLSKFFFYLCLWGIFRPTFHHIFQKRTQNKNRSNNKIQKAIFLNKKISFLHKTNPNRNKPRSILNTKCPQVLLNLVPPSSVSKNIINHTLGS